MDDGNALRKYHGNYGGTGDNIRRSAGRNNAHLLHDAANLSILMA